MGIELQNLMRREVQPSPEQPTLLDTSQTHNTPPSASEIASANEMRLQGWGMYNINYYNLPIPRGKPCLIVLLEVRLFWRKLREGNGRKPNLPGDHKGKYYYM